MASRQPVTPLKPPSRGGKRTKTSRGPVTLKDTGAVYVIPGRVDSIRAVTVWHEPPKLDMIIDTAAYVFDGKHRKVDFVSLGRRMSRHQGLTHMAAGSDPMMEALLGTKASATDGKRIGDSIVTNFGRLEQTIETLIFVVTVFNTDLDFSDAKSLSLKFFEGRTLLATANIDVVGTEEVRVLVPVSIAKIDNGHAWKLQLRNEQPIGTRTSGKPLQQELERFASLTNSTLGPPPMSAQRLSDSITPPPGFEDSGEFTGANFGVGGDDVDTDSGDDPVDQKFRWPPASRKMGGEKPPRVVREGRRDYNVGRPVSLRVLRKRASAAVAVYSSDDEDEDENANAIVGGIFPNYNSDKVVRYEGRTYNMGTDSDRLMNHFQRNRKDYMKKKRREPDAQPMRTPSPLPSDDGQEQVVSPVEAKRPPPELHSLLVTHQQQLVIAGVESPQSHRKSSSTASSTPRLANQLSPTSARQQQQEQALSGASSSAARSHNPSSTANGSRDSRVGSDTPQPILREPKDGDPLDLMTPRHSTTTSSGAVLPPGSKRGSRGGQTGAGGDKVVTLPPLESLAEGASPPKPKAPLAQTPGSKTPNSARRRGRNTRGSPMRIDSILAANGVLMGNQQRRGGNQRNRRQGTTNSPTRRQAMEAGSASEELSATLGTSNSPRTPQTARAPPITGLSPGGKLSKWLTAMMTPQTQKGAQRPASPKLSPSPTPRAAGGSKASPRKTPNKVVDRSPFGMLNTILKI